MSSRYNDKFWFDSRGTPHTEKLAGARLDAMPSFPAGIRTAFSQWQVSSTIIDGRPVRLVQGTNAGQLPVNLYFDDSGLLVRQVRWNRTPVGVVPIELDYADYRDVSGVKMPFRTIVTWSDGQNTIQRREVRPNVPIDAERFTRPEAGPFSTPAEVRVGHGLTGSTRGRGILVMAGRATAVRRKEYDINPD